MGGKVPRPGAGGARGEEQGGAAGLGHPHLSAGMKAAMAFDVARGMLHLHENGFLHGGLKPKNVLVGGRAGGGLLEVHLFFSWMR